MDPTKLAIINAMSDNERMALAIEQSALEAREADERASRKADELAIINGMSYDERMAFAIRQSALEAREANERAAREANERAAREAAARASHNHAVFVLGHEVRSDAVQPAVVARAFSRFTAAEMNTRGLDEVSRKLEEAVKQNKQLTLDNELLRQQLGKAERLTADLLAQAAAFKSKEA
jgi:hypothetical protein